MDCAGDTENAGAQSSCFTEHGFAFIHFTFLQQVLRAKDMGMC